jgi:ABC-type Fe3+-hydroxamate transport system substrate-binding protein
LHVLHITALNDVPAELARLALAVGAAPPDTHIHTHTRANTNTEADRVGLRVWVPIWRRPWMSINASTYGSSLLAAVGLTNVFADATERYPTVDLDQVMARRPDLVLAPSEPYAFSERHRPELESVAPVVFVDGKDLFWWGARTPGARARLAELAAQLARASKASKDL